MKLPEVKELFASYLDEGTPQPVESISSIIKPNQNK